MDIQFRALDLADCALVYKWFHEPWVKKWFSPDACEYNKFFDNHKKKLNRESEWHFIALFNNIPFGYICYYDAFIEVDMDEPEGTYGIDLFIGNSEFIGKGFGKKMVSSFIKYMLETNKNISRIIVDPHINNFPAFNMYLSLGFQKTREVVDPHYGQMIIMDYPIPS